ncbi:hypothetical protein R3P38DRAFT_770695 [Favolaschia claudopus]|uniref:Uncharacterized protein n=1 Tax=Favolaschia claudopus TaxID=2862362 RepID=A0AAW0C2A3_9AGAR
MATLAEPAVASNAEPELEIIDLTGETTASEGEEEEGSSRNSGSDSDSDEPSRAQLREAILRVPSPLLRRVLIDMADAVPAVQHALTKELVTVSRTTRVVVPRWEQCENCDATYDVNEEGDMCTFHPGEMEVDDEKFVDWDEDCHGPMDCDENRRQFPENFLWSCCEADGMSGGCATGKHTPVQHKRRRF